jgi:hypothetical protein
MTIDIAIKKVPTSLSSGVKKFIIKAIKLIIIMPKSDFSEMLLLIPLSPKEKL